MFIKDNSVFICKNDIDKQYLYFHHHGFSQFNKAYLKREFDEYIDFFGADEVRITGSKFDKKRQRHTEFVNLYYFYKFVVKGFDRL